MWSTSLITYYEENFQSNFHLFCKAMLQNSTKKGFKVVEIISTDFDHFDLINKELMVQNWHASKILSKFQNPIVGFTNKLIN